MKRHTQRFLNFTMFALCLILIIACRLNPLTRLQSTDSSANEELVGTAIPTPLPEATPIPIGFTSYLNEPGGYELFYPIDWRAEVVLNFDMIVSDEKAFEATDLNTISGAAITIVSDLNDASSAGYQEMIANVQNLIGLLTNQETTIETVVNQRKLTINGYPATKTVVEITNQATGIGNQTTFIVVQGNYQILLLTASISNEMVATQEAMVEQMINSLRLFKPKNMIIPPLLGIPASRENKSNKIKSGLETLIESTERRLIGEISLNSYTGAPMGIEETLQWTFNGTAGQIIDIELLTFQGIDPILEVIGPENNSIFANGPIDYSTGPNEIAYQVELPADGVYTIEVFDYQQQGGGVDLRVLDGGSAKDAIQHISQELRLGETIQIDIETDDYGGAKTVAIPLRLSAGTIANLQVASSEAIDVSLEIINARGESITAGIVDQGYSIESITALQFPEDGEYTLFVRPISMANQEIIGNRIEVSMTETRPDSAKALQDLQSAAIPLELGNETPESFLTRGSYDVWSFEGTAGTIIEIAQRSQTTGLLVDLIGPDGRSVLAGSQAFSISTPTRNVIRGVNLPETGTYLVTIRAESANNGGLYKLYIGE